MIDKRTLKLLLENGVDSAVILKLLDDEQEAPSVAEPEAPAVEEPKPVSEEKNAPVEKPAVEKTDPVLAAIEKLTGAIYKSNIMNDSREHGSIETTDSILAKLINPDE